MRACSGTERTENWKEREREGGSRSKLAAAIALAAHLSFERLPPPLPPKVARSFLLGLRVGREEGGAF